MSPSVVLDLPVAVRKRIERAGGTQPRHGQCVRCGKNWDTCPCSRAQVNTLLDAYRLEQALRDL